MDDLIIQNIKEIKDTLVRIDKDVKHMHTFLMKHMDEEAKNIGEIRVDIAKMQAGLAHQRDLHRIAEEHTKVKEKRVWSVLSRVLSTIAISAVTALGALIYSGVI